MSNTDLYQDIATRTGGSLFVGVLGPVRTGKSTFIKRFMEICVIPNIENVYRRERAIDELPQSGSGRTIMTAEPKFVPEEAVEVALDGGATFAVRLIDSVGYMVPGAMGQFEDGTPRMVMTPWMDHEIPMAEAVEIGTRKAIQEHSTVGIVITTDGSVTDIPREDYLEAEERVITELQELAAVKANYDKVSAALSNVYDTGYGIVMPTMEELEEPEVMRQGGRYGIKLKASAPSIHMFKVDIESAVSPIVGNEKQSEDMVNYLMEKFSGDPTQIWESNIFGRSFHELVNEGSGGLICIIL